jgi:Alcohol dehydrogenase GroES-like domain
MPEPSGREVRIKVRVSGVGPTDLKIRRGDLKAVFPLPEPAVLGFETAGVVDAIGGEVSGVAVGDEVAAWLPSLGGYGEYALAAAWTRKPPQVTWNDAGALPASVEAAVGVLRQLEVADGETLLILGAGGRSGSSPRSWRFGRGSRSSEPSAGETRRSSESSEPRQSPTGATCSPTYARSPIESMRPSMPRARADLKRPSRSPAAPTA